MSRGKVWISGWGAICAAGSDEDSILNSFAAGRQNFSTSLPFETAVNYPTFQVSDLLEKPVGRHLGDRTLRLAVYAVNQAVACAGIRSFADGVRVGVCLGTTVACQLNSLPFYAAYRRGKEPPLDRVYDFLNGNLAQAIARELGVKGPRMTVVNACSSSTDSIGVAASWIRAGLCDVAIAGGADEMYQVPVAGFWSLGVMSAEPCRPFDRDRNGLNLGEGAGVVVLESAEFSEKRGAKHLFEVAGYGSALDAYHLTAPHPEGRGLEAAIRGALGQAEIQPGRIAFVNAHGTATLDNDRTEAKVLQRVFGNGAVFLSTKGFTGHTLGAAGGLEAVFALLGLKEGWIPGNVGFENLGEDISVAPVRDRSAVSGEYAMSTSLAFGGNNAALIIRRVA